MGCWFFFGLAALSIFFGADPIEMIKAPPTKPEIYQIEKKFGGWPKKEPVYHFRVP